MSNVEVTPEYIAAVVEHRRLVCGPDWVPDHLERACITGDIAALLTHLHANPRVPSDEEVEQIRKAVQLRFPECIDVAEYWREWTIESRRIQFAPKTAAVPDAVKEMIAKLGMSDPGDVRAVTEVALAAMQLGIQMGKAK